VVSFLWCADGWAFPCRWLPFLCVFIFSVHSQFRAVLFFASLVFACFSFVSFLISFLSCIPRVRSGARRFFRVACFLCSLVSVIAASFLFMFDCLLVFSLIVSLLGFEGGACFGWLLCFVCLVFFVVLFFFGMCVRAMFVFLVAALFVSTAPLRPLASSKRLRCTLLLRVVMVLFFVCVEGVSRFIWFGAPAASELGFGVMFSARVIHGVAGLLRCCGFVD